MKTRWYARLTRTDIAALLVFLAVWIYYIFMVRYGVSFADEGFYVAVAERFVRGERPLVDEWQVSQLSFLFLCLPYKIYVALTGGTNGIILFMRYLFLAFNAAVYWFVYLHLRERKWLTLIATVLFCGYVPFGIYACNYYTVPIRLLLVVCLLLFSENPRRTSLFAAGVLFACAVLYQPGFALLYPAFSVLVCVRFFARKKEKRFLEDYAFCLSGRTWKYLSLGVLLAAAVFCGWLLRRSGLRDILRSVPYLLLTDPEYDYTAGGSAWSVFFRKLADAAGLYGRLCWIAALIVIALSAAFACGLFRACRASVRKCLFVLACAVWVFSCVQTFRISAASTADWFFVVYPAPLFWFGFVCYLLCEHKNKRFFWFWIVGLASSLCVDVLSDITVAIGTPVAAVADLVFITDLVRELRAEYAAQKTRGRADAKKTARIAVRVCAGLLCGCFAFWSAFVLLYLENPCVSAHTISAVPLGGGTVRCKDGPCRGLRYPPAYEKNYSDKLSDVDAIRRRQPENLYIYNIAPEMYLYAGLPYATYSAYALGKTSVLERHLLYWKLHPEKLPACVFVPFDRVEPSAAEKEGTLDKICAFFDPLCAYTVETGKSGYILYVSHWKPLDGA